jgi:hypothetical protein
MRRRRIPAGAKQAAEKGMFLAKIGKKRPSGAKAQPLLCCVCGTTEQLGEKVENLGETGQAHATAAKASLDSAGFMRGLKPTPPSVSSFSPICKVMPCYKASEHLLSPELD